MQTSVISGLILQIKPLLEIASSRGHVLPPSCPAPSSEEQSIPIISLQSNAGICTGLQGLDCSYLGCSLAASATGFFGGLWLGRKERALHTGSCLCLLLQLNRVWETPLPGCNQFDWAALQLDTSHPCHTPGGTPGTWQEQDKPQAALERHLHPVTGRYTG